MDRWGEGRDRDPTPRIPELLTRLTREHAELDFRCWARHPWGTPCPPARIGNRGSHAWVSSRHDRWARGARMVSADSSNH